MPLLSLLPCQLWSQLLFGLLLLIFHGAAVPLLCRSQPDFSCFQMSSLSPSAPASCYSCLILYSPNYTILASFPAVTSCLCGTLVSHDVPCPFAAGPHPPIALPGSCHCHRQSQLTAVHQTPPLNPNTYHQPQLSRPPPARAHRPLGEHIHPRPEMLGPPATSAPAVLGCATDV